MKGWDVPKWRKQCFYIPSKPLSDEREFVSALWKVKAWMPILRVQQFVSFVWLDPSNNFFEATLLSVPSLSQMTFALRLSFISMQISL